VHRVNLEPTSLQPTSSASKNETPVKVQPVNAVPSCREALKRDPAKVQRSKVAPALVVSDRSTSSNRQSR
jgi:hypothetical protein